jgi:hypothetical protein
MRQFDAYEATRGLHKELESPGKLDLSAHHCPCIEISSKSLDEVLSQENKLGQDVWAMLGGQKTY